MTHEQACKILKVSSSASLDEVNRAYQTLARKYHPDNNPGNMAAEEIFKQIRLANDILITVAPSSGVLHRLQSWFIRHR